MDIKRIFTIISILAIFSARPLFAQTIPGGGGGGSITGTPTLCDPGDSSRGIFANGNAAGCFTPSGSGNVSGPGFSTDGHLVQFNGASGTSIKDGLAVTNANTASAVVQRDASGNFAAGTITATTFTGNLTGNVTGNITGNATGNAGTATNIANNTGTTTTLLHGNAAGAPSFSSVVVADIGSAAKEGTGTKVQLFTGADPNTNDCAKFDANHNLVTHGGPCNSPTPGSNTQLLFNNGGVTGAITGATSNGTNTTFADGTARLTNPWIATGVLDGNGNPRFQFAAVASAVDAFKFTTAAAGDPSTIILEPSDQVTPSPSINVNILFRAKGAGSVCLKSCNGLGTFSLGSITYNGSGSGAITTQTQAAAGTYNWNWPTTAGTSGQLLTSGGGGSTAMTWTTNNFAQKIASGSKALATSSISSAACSSAQTATATGTLTSDTVVASFNGDTDAVTGYIPLTSGMLTIKVYPTADTVNFKVCNNTTSSVTPGAITLNWAVIR